MSANAGGNNAATEALDLLKQIALSTDEAERATLTDEYLLAVKPIARYIGADLCRKFKADPNTWKDDFISLVWEEAYKLVAEVVAKPSRADEFGSLRAILGYRGKSKATAFIDSSAGFNQASGMASLKRRVKELERTRATLWSLYGREPSDIEIVEETNKRLRESRADSARQGMECKVEDLHAFDAVESIDSHHNAAVVPSVESDSDLHRTERARLVMLCIAECDKENETLGKVARILYADAMGDYFDDFPSAASVARELGIEASTARAKVGRVKKISQEVARQKFRIRVVEEGPEDAAAS